MARVPEVGLHVRYDRRGDGVVVVVSGELDLATADVLSASLRVPEAKATTVILDLRELSFIDSSGLSVIVAQRRRAEEQEFRFAVAVGTGTAAERLFELSGLRGTIALVEDPDALVVP